MKLNKKYLVTNGCSQTWGENCHIDQTYPQVLGKRLGLEVINLATPGTGWYKVENSTLSFIHNNKDILDECFFILQKSALERLLDYNNLPLFQTDRWEKYNIKYVSMYDFTHLGVDDYGKFDYPKTYVERNDSQFFNLLYDRDEFEFFDKHYPSSYYRREEFSNTEKHAKLKYFPEHKHYPNSRHKWRLGENYDIYPPFIDEQFEEMMLHWGMRISSYHLFLKNMGIDHIIVDGYSPFLSYKLNFRNYYDTDEEFEFVKKFWDTETNDPENEMVYDFKNIKAGYLFDSIESKYKIDDVVLWSLYQFKQHQSEWNADGSHAGPKGMELICDVIEKNLKEKGWF